MTSNVDSLQEVAVPLLQALYLDKKLTTTEAINSVFNGNYPSVRSILATLDRYKDDSLVIEFKATHASAIAAAKESLKAKNSEVADKEPDSWRDRNDAYKSLKSVSIEQIEQALSKSISEVCGKDLMLEINGIQKTGFALLEAELSIHIKSRHA